MLEKIKNIKTILPLDVDSLFEAERLLNEMQNSELLAEFEKFPFFEHLHNEKLSPVFLKLEKNANKEAKLCDIVDANGATFSSPPERNDYIVSFFANIYKKNGKW